MNRDANDLSLRIRGFLEEHAYPLEPLLFSNGFHAIESKLAALRDQVKAMGLWAPPLPEDFGGMGLSLAEFAPLSEEMGRSPLGHYLFNCQAPDIGNMELLLEHASDDLKERWLWPLTRGEIRSCFAMTEPDYPGSNPTWMGATAVRENDSYVINGRKWFTTAADGAAFAIVMAKTNPDAGKPHEQYSQIIVPAETPGVNLDRNIPIMGEAGEGYFSHGEVTFQNCRAPIANRIGEEGGGFALAQQRLGPGRIHHCMRWIGICSRAFEMMCQRAAERELSPGRPLGSMQAVQHWIAECNARIRAARLMTLQAAEKIDRQGARACREEISTIKFYVADALLHTLDRAIQVHGAFGLTDDLLLSFWYRHERGARIYDGADEVHKSLAARLILKQYGLRLKD